MELKRSERIAGWKAAGKLEKREEAENRTADWRRLTPEEQITSLDTRLGKGIGAKKQRARIIKEIANKEEPETPIVTEEEKQNNE